MPTSKLTRILDMLDNEHIAEVVGNDHEMARESFPLHSNTVSSHPEFHDTIVSYYKHHSEKTIGAGVAVPDDKVTR